MTKPPRMPDTNTDNAKTSSDSAASARFAHLHLHTEYSLLDGGNKITPLLNRAKELGMDSIAVTDHGNLFGAIEFYSKARAAGVKPILGIEAYVAPQERTLKARTGVADGGFHLVLLAENKTGWSNLIKLSSDSFINGFYRKPRMDKQTLQRWSDGLIAINGHLGSSLAHYLLLYAQTNNEAHFDAAVEEAQWHAQAFGTNENGESRFFVELQRNGVSEQDRINPHLMRLAKQLDLPLVCDNDAHFLTAADHDTHDSLCCISMGKTKNEPNRLRYPTELYVKSPQQMAELFADVPEAIENAVRIAERCNVELDFSASHAPVVKIVRHDESPDDANSAVGSTEWFKKQCERFRVEPFDTHAEPDISKDDLSYQCDAALKDLCTLGLTWRYGQSGAKDPQIIARLERELGILADKNISAYFLIVWDFVNWARQQGIPAGARGSGVGTMVGYVLGLSNACPVRYGLLFERFTDPDRSEYPDIDIDICQDGRAKVLEYVRQKYGHVAQIITFGRLKARAAIKDVARVNGLLPAEGQRLANLVPQELNITIDSALEKEPDFKNEYDGNPQSRAVIDTARALEHHARHAGVHAAGVVIATEPLDNIVPLCKATGGDDIITQWDGPTCERVGLLKMDFLGLRTLSTMERAIGLIHQTLPEDAIWNAVGRTPNDGGPHPLDLERIEFTDQRVLDLFRRADTAGVFQFESGGMRKLLRDMLPDRLEDLIAANALFRPGPMDLIPEYCKRKHGREPVPKLHAIVDEYTAETYGIMVYQEQVMQIVHALGDIPLRSAYTLIKAISKKKHDVIDAERPKFLDGAQHRGLTKQQANQLFDHILKFAGYGFNKSHSTGYAIIAYHTAYLKTYYPNQYMAAVMTFESSARKIEDWVPYLEDCKRTPFPDNCEATPHIGLEVRPPDVNRSEADFSVTFDDDEPRTACTGHIRFGLGAIRNAGKSAISAVIKERNDRGPFHSIFDFCERLSSRTVNRATIESLIKAGAFDSVHSAQLRAAILASLDDAIAAGQTLASDRQSGQLNIFAAMGGDDDATASTTDTSDQLERPLPAIPPWDELIMLGHEKDVLGFHITGHPLDQFADDLAQYCNTKTTSLPSMAQDAPVVIGGMLTEVRFVFSKRGTSEGQRMAILRIQDRHGTIAGVMFPDDFGRFGQHLTRDAIVLLVGRVDLTRSDPQIIISAAFPLPDAAAHLAGDIQIDFMDDEDTHGPARGQMQMVRGILTQASANPSGESGRTAGVLLRILNNGHAVTLKSRPLKAVATGDLLSRLRQVVGDENVHIMPGDYSYLLERTNRPRYPQRKSREPVEV